MKKFFLPLLALVGMTVGFTLSSCGGGGGGDGLSATISGLYVETVSGIPLMSLTVEERLGKSNGYSAMYTIGPSRNSYPGGFSVLPDYPKLMEDGRIEIVGYVGIDTVEILSDKEFIGWMGGSPSANNLQLQSLIKMTITVPKKGYNDGRMKAEVTGVQWITVDKKDEEPLPTQRDYNEVYINAPARLYKEISPATSEGANP